MKQPTTHTYDNAERLCECWKCELSYGNGGDCPFDQSCSGTRWTYNEAAWGSARS